MGVEFVKASMSGGSPLALGLARAVYSSGEVRSCPLRRCLLNRKAGEPCPHNAKCYL